MKKTTISLLVAPAVLLWTTQSFAVLELDAITVTAQKQEENLQEVPVAVSVFSSVDIEDRNIDSALEMVEHVPNVIFHQDVYPGTFMPSFRGMYSPSSSLNASGGIFVDGVPLLSPFGFQSDLLDVERVEVLRGPQGTIYGKGAQAGVINVVSRKPGNDFRGKVSAWGGEDDRRQLKFSVGGPIQKDNLFFSVAGNYSHKDGFIENTRTTYGFIMMIFHAIQMDRKEKIF